MDTELGRWVLEFVANAGSRRNTTESSKSNDLIRKLVRAIPLSKSVYRSNKTALLNLLQQHLSTASFSEDTLRMLEVLEELHRRIGSPVSSAMVAAYCAVAVECTLKFLEVDDSHSNSRAYLRAVDRIWRGRVPHMEPSASGGGSLLFSAELKRWTSEIEASLHDPQARERLGNLNSRRDAILKLKACLAEAWEDLSPSFLEVASSTATQTTELHGPGNELGASASPEQPQRVKNMNLEPPIENQTTEAPIEDQSTEAPIENRTANTPIENQCIEATNENQTADAPTGNLRADAPLENQIADADFREQNVCQTTNHMDGLTKMKNSSQKDVDHPSLMERNNTARTYEWDESADGLHEKASDHANKIQLPSPKGEKMSPLKKYEPPNITMRRKRKKWSAFEEETLKTAVNLHGEGNWKLILNSYRDIFAERTQVDLKDKWRNLTRYGAK